MKEAAKGTDQTRIRDLLEKWATETSFGKHDKIPANHSPEVAILDVLPSLKRGGADAYRRSWEELTSFCSFGPLDLV